MQFFFPFLGGYIAGGMEEDESGDQGPVLLVAGRKVSLRNYCLAPYLI